MIPMDSRRPLALVGQYVPLIRIPDGNIRSSGEALLLGSVLSADHC